MRFENKIAVVFGGNSGIGLATAAELVKGGAKVAICGRSQETLAAAQNQYDIALAEVCDIADMASVDEFVTKVKAELGRIDILVVNSGIGAFAGVREVTPELWDQIHDVNLKGNFFAAQKCLDLMGGGGSIIFTGSIGGVLALAGNTVYALCQGRAASGGQKHGEGACRGRYKSECG